MELNTEKQELEAGILIDYDEEDEERDFTYKLKILQLKVELDVVFCYTNNALWLDDYSVEQVTKMKIFHFIKVFESKRRSSIVVPIIKCNSCELHLSAYGYTSEFLKITFLDAHENEIEDFNFIRVPKRSIDTDFEKLQKEASISNVTLHCRDGQELKVFRKNVPSRYP